jgi:hypothetical protein
MIQTGRSRVRDLMRSNESSSMYLILPVALSPGVYSTPNKNEYGVERSRCVGLTILPPSLSRLSRQCGILNISQPCRRSRPVTRIALLLYRRRNLHSFEEFCLLGTRRHLVWCCTAVKTSAKAYCHTNILLSFYTVHDSIEGICS